MTVGQLIDELSFNYDRDVTIRLLSQPDRHPLEYSIREVTDAESPNSHENTVYLVEGGQIGYGPHGV